MFFLLLLRDERLYVYINPHMARWNVGLDVAVGIWHLFAPPCRPTRLQSHPPLNWGRQKADTKTNSRLLPIPGLRLCCCCAVYCVYTFGVWPTFLTKPGNTKPVAPIGPKIRVHPRHNKSAFTLHTP